ncbi:alpha/beta fold hydrolase [Candidatus Woesearchaeota archaeon]|nr:alpha/beta fold hydrolase [Candidatus Woesearchaeota archaeon]
MQYTPTVIQNDEIDLDALLISDNHKSLVVIAHGQSGRAAAFIPLAKHLADHHDVLLYSLRAHKFTDKFDPFRQALSQDHHGSKGKFSVLKAIEDQKAVLESVVDRYDSIGFFGFSVGATISAYAAQDTGFKDKLNALYMASAFLDASDIEWVGWYINTFGGTASSGIHSLAHPTLLECNPGIDLPIRVAIAKQDRTLKSPKRIKVFNDIFGEKNVVQFMGNYCFNKTGFRYFGYTGKVFGDEKPEMTGRKNLQVYNDVSTFFNQYLHT